jgi:hypothetical protein
MTAGFGRTRRKLSAGTVADDHCHNSQQSDVKRDQQSEMNKNQAKGTRMAQVWHW